MNLKIDCEAFELFDDNLITGFDCGDNDLNDFLIAMLFFIKMNG